MPDKMFQTILDDTVSVKDWGQIVTADEIPGVGCLVQVAHYIERHRGPLAVGLTFVPGVHIVQGKLRPFGGGP